MSEERKSNILTYFETRGWIDSFIKKFLVEQKMLNYTSLSYLSDFEFITKMRHSLAHDENLVVPYGSILLLYEIGKHVKSMGETYFQLNIESKGFDDQQNISLDMVKQALHIDDAKNKILKHLIDDIYKKRQKLFRNSKKNWYLSVFARW